MQDKYDKWLKKFFQYLEKETKYLKLLKHKANNCNIELDYLLNICSCENQYTENIF